MATEQLVASDYETWHKKPSRFSRGDSVTWRTSFCPRCRCSFGKELEHGAPFEACVQCGLLCRTLGNSLYVTDGPDTEAEVRAKVFDDTVLALARAVLAQNPEAARPLVDKATEILQEMAAPA